jgi:sugar O-acyltransferase (sialic acid O-acetyltransferase NeuD family)
VRLVIFGTGGFGRELVRPAQENHSAVVFADDRETGPVLGVPVLRSDQIRPDDEVVIAVGNSAIREQIAQRVGGRAAKLISRTALIGPGVEIDEGAVICDHSIVTASARIGRHFHCNIYSYVAHDCVIGDFVTFAPRVCCNGNVHVGDHAYIGTGAVIKQGVPGRPLVIGEGAVVGMGAVVTKDVPAGVTVVGNPARAMEAAGPAPLQAAMEMTSRLVSVGR